ncbi:NCK-interacting protein with SH3 domain [Trichonephila clavipes]|uniref:NCK-interacting protein with SH3 domain n=1 Tax=Trichonephila clavipes TaxID=2585209 RepID=A0A8X6SNJ9_TRICX|nr:NCK-interacting protein with SH3 domain [Trichonephila clavipes]
MSETDIFVYSALYDLSSGHKQVLLFNKGDRFIPIPNCSSNPNWAVCVDKKGIVGYVPYTYVEKKQVSIQEFIWLIDDALEKLHVDSPSISKLTREVIKNLTSLRTNLLTSNNCKIKETQEENNEIPINNNSSPVVDSPQEVLNSIESHGSSNNLVGKIVENAEPKTQESAENSALKTTAQTETQTECINDFNVPNWLVPALVENVRHKTKISHENSKAAVGIILDTFLDAIPHLDLLWLQMKKNLTESEAIEEVAKEVVHSEDQRKLLDIFKQLWYCKNDEQQRSWPVHEDEDLISGLLIEMNNIFV